MPLTFNFTHFSVVPAYYLPTCNDHSTPVKKHVLQKPNGNVFQATWNAHNKQFKETFLEKVARTVFFPINSLIARSILPATQRSASEIAAVENRFQRKWNGGSVMNEDRFLRSHFMPIPIEAPTPDKVMLKGTFFKNLHAPANAPTVIFFQPNNALSKAGAFDWALMQAALQEFPYHFVYFDYRGVGESKGVPHSKKDLYLDGDTIFQYVRDKLHIPENEIHFYGFSLGGGVASNVKNPESLSRLVNDRSFNSIDNAITNLLKMFKNFLHQGTLLFSFATNETLISIAAKFASFWTSFLNWNMQSAKAIEKLKGKTLVLHHPEDEMMKDKASLYRSLFQRATPPPLVSELNLQRFSSFDPPYIHGCSLDSFASANGDNAENETAQFLFGSNLSFSQRMLERFRTATPEFRNHVFTLIAQRQQPGRHYWGSGEDAFYNRNGLTMTDTMRIDAIVKAKIMSAAA